MTADTLASLLRPGARTAPRIVSTHFDFRHKLFTLPEAVFRPDSTGKPAFHGDLGDVRCALDLKTIAREFGIDPESHDGRLLTLVERSLRYVKEIRPGDSIPNEILDGSCSWTIDDRHRRIARQRLTLRLASWMTGGEITATDPSALEQIAEDPGMKKRIHDGAVEAAQRLGLGRDRRLEILNRIETVARELAYIEAQRERLGDIRAAVDKIGSAAQIYRRDRSVLEEITRVQMLLRRPLADFDADFELVDAQTGEILALLRNVDAQILFIRELRDMIHFKLMAWDEILALWKSLKVERSDAVERAIRQFYQFAARNFPLESRWSTKRSI